MTIQTFDFRLTEWGDEARDDQPAFRTLRAFTGPGGITVVDAGAPAKLSEGTVFLTVINGRSDLCSANPDAVEDWLDREMRESGDDDFVTVYSRDFIVLRVDFDLEDGAIEAARDVTDDFAAKLIRNDDCYFAEDGEPDWGGPDIEYERAAYQRRAL